MLLATTGAGGDWVQMIAQLTRYSSAENLSNTTLLFAVPALIGGITLLGAGARLAPAITGLLFGAGGALAGKLVGDGFGISPWFTGLIGGVSGAALGLLLLRFWMALLLASALTAGASAMYYARALAPHVAEYTSVGLHDGVVQLPDGQGALAEDRDVIGELSELWRFLALRVPNLELNAMLLLGSGVLVGLGVGLLFPKLARSLWASTTGMLLLIGGGVPLTFVLAPGVGEWAAETGVPLWGIAGAVWAVATLLNYWSLGGKPKKPASVEAPAPAAVKPASL